MPGSQLRFAQVYDLPPEIVWDALIDSDLVSGWLAEADIEPRIGGRYDLDWSHLEPGLHTDGEILELDDARLLIFDTRNFGRTSFLLDELAGGSRARSTRLTVEVHALADRHFSGRLSATWQISLEQLGDLLHGHPVDWAGWLELNGARWNELLAESSRRK